MNAGTGHAARRAGDGTPVPGRPAGTAGVAAAASPAAATAGGRGTGSAGVKVPVLPVTVCLYTGLAGLGTAALASALASSLLVRAGSLAGTAAVPVWAGGVASIVWAMAVLAFSVASLRTGRPVWPRTATSAFTVAAAVHLATVLAGLWLGPAAERTFDLNAACAVVLELSIVAGIGWLGRHGTERAGTEPAGGSPDVPAAPPAGRLLAALFAASVLVAAVTTPGLAASTAGHSAVPHGGHHSTGTTGPTVPGTLPIPAHQH
ncbi:hypothetical protein ACQCSX_19895 [Pseudarthrobacter sp. P1]|uniref:hypothetical protein n=1 Tax=Pseudarthrobacter sp. P1 TaxID=3418418 RepID=UPI003CF26FF7